MSPLRLNDQFEHQPTADPLTGARGVAQPGTAQAHSAPSGSQEITTMAQYFRDVRRYPLLSHERELILGRHIQEGRTQWREKLLHHLLHIPLVLACRSGLRRGSVQPADIWETKSLPPLSDMLKRLDHLQQLRCHMRRHFRQAFDRQDATTVHVMAQLRTDMRALFVAWSWQPAFLHQAWMRFTTGMATTSPVRQYRQVRRYISTLGYSLGELRALWCTLHQLYGGAERAKQEMVTRNLRLVVSVAREFSHLGLPLTDLVQEGNIGLMRAAERYDYRRNLKFSTYAIWWIKQAIRRAAFEQSALIRIPEYMYESSRHVAQAQQRLAAELGRTPTVQEIAEHLELPVARVERSLELVREPISLDRPLWEDEAHTLGETLADTEAHSTQELLVQQALVDHTHRALDQLTPREAEVIRRRFGLHGKPGETLRQIGEDLDLSHERVRQIEAEALCKLRDQHASLQVFLEP